MNIQKEIERRFLLQEEYMGTNKPVNHIEPLVSVTVAAYQHEPYIKQCLEGILMQQTNFPFEIILGEDDSKDNTRAICIEYAEKYPEKIRLFLRDRNISHLKDKNGKLIKRLNGVFGFSRMSARGKYLACCEGDDYLTDPLKLQKQVDFLEENPEYVLVGSLAGKIYEKENFKKIHYPNAQNDFDFDTRYLILQNPISTLTVCFRSGVVTEIPDIYFSGGSGGDRRLYISKKAEKNINSIHASDDEIEAIEYLEFVSL